MSVAEWIGWWQHRQVVASFPLSEAGKSTLAPNINLLFCFLYSGTSLLLVLQFSLFFAFASSSFPFKGHTIPLSKQEKIPIAITSGDLPLPVDMPASMIILPCLKSSPTGLTHLPWLLIRTPSSAQVPSNPAARRLRPSPGRTSVDVSVTHRPLLTSMRGTRKKIIRP